MSYETSAFIKIISVKSKIKTMHILSSHLRKDLKIFSNLNAFNTSESHIKSIDQLISSNAANL